MRGTSSQLGVVAVAASWRGQITDDATARLCEVLDRRFAARVVAVPDRQLASPAHARRALAAVLKDVADLGVVLIVVTGTVCRFARRSGDVVSLALPGSVPGRPGSMLALSDLLSAAADRPDVSVVVCADLTGEVSPEQVADALPGASVLVTVAAARGSHCHDALAVALAEIDGSCALGDVLDAAARKASAQVAVRHNGRTPTVTPTARPSALPVYVLEDVASADPGSRLDAVNELAALADRDPLALAQLRQLADADPDRGVRDFASRRLSRADRPTLPHQVRAGRIPTDLLEEARNNPDLPQLIDQPGGWVTLGVDAPDGDDSCRPRHQVDLPAYRLGRTVVTNRQYLAFVAATGHPCPDHWAGGENLWDDEQRPVVMVSLLDADRYCAWLTGQLHAADVLPAGWRVRLPSEAEWEAAASNHRADPYPWGRSARPWPANTRATGLGAVLPAGRFPEGANATGCEDLIGNVWEWTRSRWGASGRTPTYRYPYDRHDGREATASIDPSVRFVVRGGAYYYATACANSFTRNRVHATARHPAGGFRPAATRSEADAG